MQRNLRLFSTIAFFLCGWLALAGTASAAAGGNDGNPNNRGALALPVTGTATVPGGEGGSTAATFSGLFHLHRFDERAGVLVAVGVLVGTVSDGTTTTTVVRGGVVMPVTLPSTPVINCEPLHLDLGPVALTLPNNIPLLLDVIALDISAEPGVGNPLANLLCAIGGRINAGGPLATLIANLNQLIAILS